MIEFNTSPVFPNSTKRTVFSEFFPYFLLNQSLAVLVSTDTKYYSKVFYVNKDSWARFFLLSRLSIPSILTIVVDGAQFLNSFNQFVVQFNLTNTLLDDRTSVYTHIEPRALTLSSVSSIFSSCIWLERELSDFTNITFLGLIDTRRLLLDYFESKTSWQTHISNDKNYNEVLYDVFLSY